ncbi:hypothetical protein C8F04DRAFT_941214, partial [Mycena alexandri]
MVKTANKFRLKFDALALTKEVKGELPLWFHHGAKIDLGRHNNSVCATCLRNKHGVRSVEDILIVIERNYYRHSRRRNCACDSCKSDRLKGCEYPYKCQEEAIKILDCINEKWDPRLEVNQPNAELTNEELARNTTAIDEKEEVIFDPKITMNRVEDGYRVF